jgi:raffinose/stachyose/melibiose transport system substrate-binding protein
MSRRLVQTLSQYLTQYLTKSMALVVIFAMLLSACAPAVAPAAGGDSGQAASDSGSAAPAAGEKVTLVMWHNHPEWKDRVQAILDVFEQENPNIHIELEEIPGPDYPVKRNTSITAGEAADLIAFAPGSELRSAAESGYIYDLTDLLNVESLTQSALDASKVDDKVYAVPILGLYTVALYYHRSIFEEQGLTPPTTWDELFAVGDKLKEAGIAPMMAPAQDGVIPFFLYMLAASSILKADGFEKIRTGERKLTDPDLLPAAQFVHDLFPYFQEGALGTPYVEGKALFAHQQAAMMEGGSADFAGFTEVNPEVNLGVVPFPAPAGGTPSTVTGMEAPFTINAKTEHLDEAVTFMQWMLTEKPGQMVADTITLPTIQGVTPSDNPTIQEMIEASRSNDVRVWYEFPETAGVGDAVNAHVQELFTDAITPEQFAQFLQDSIVPSGGQ